MKIQVTQSIDSPSSDTLDSFEQECRVKLPNDFVEFLAYGNGGVPEKKVFAHSGSDRLIERFLPMMEDPNSDAIGEYDISVVMTQLDERLGDDPNEIGYSLIPIAMLFAGDFLCLDFRSNSQQPKVVLWDHNLSDEFSPHTEFVANSFTELTEMLS